MKKIATDLSPARSAELAARREDTRNAITERKAFNQILSEMRQSLLDLDEQP